MRPIFLALLAVLLFAASATAQVPTSWSQAKNKAADHVYDDNPTTLYCGCTYESHNDSDGSGDMDLAACGMTPLSKKKSTAKRMEWEHIVPASLMPARQFACWKNPAQFTKCKSGNNVKGGRQCCETVSTAAKRMMFDLHNLAPAIGQVNQYRLNDRYGTSPTVQLTRSGPAAT